MDEIYQIGKTHKSSCQFSELWSVLIRHFGWKTQHLKSIIFWIVAGGCKIFVFIAVLCLQYLFKVLEAFFEAFSDALPWPPGKLFDDAGSLASGFLLAVFETFESVRALISGDDGKAFLHFEVDGIDF